jgi:hypothetical protein
MRAPGRARAAWWAVALLTAGATPAFALRPFDGTDAAVAEPQSVEVEFQPLGYLREADERWLLFPKGTINYGAGSGWEFNLELTRMLAMTEVEPTPTPRYEDFELGVKRVVRAGLMQGKKGPSLAAEADLLLPTSDEKGTGIAGSLIYSDHFRWVGLHLTGEVANTRARELGRFGSAIFEFFDRHSAHPVMELTAERKDEHTTTLGLLGGVLWEPRARLVLDLALRTSYADQHNAEVRAGITFGKHVPHGPEMP